MAEAKTVSFPRRGLGVGLPLDVNLALQVGTLFDRDTLGRNIPRGHRRLAQLNTFTGLNVAFQLSLHDDDFRFHAGFHLAVRPNGQAVSFQRDSSLDLTVYVEVFAAR